MELTQKINEVTTVKDLYISKILENFSYTSDWLYGARLGVELVPNKDRLWTIVDYRLNTAASYAPPPSREALENMAKTLREELDTAKTSNEELSLKYKQEIDKANVAVLEEKKRADEVAAKQKELGELKEKHSNELVAAQNKAITEQNLAISEVEQRKDNEARAAIEKNKRLIMITCGSLSLIGLAAAIWLPVFKREAAWFAGITGGVALLVPFLQPIHLNIIFGLGILYVLFLAVRKHLNSEKDKELAQRTNNNLINFVQDVKETKPETYEEIKPLLEERNTKYVNGNEKVEDTEVVNHIDGVLRDYERK